MFSKKEAEKLKKDCIEALNKAGHRTKKRRSNNRRQRSDKSIVDNTDLSRLRVADSKKLGYKNWVEWQEKTGYESQDTIEDDYSENSEA